MGNTAGLIGKLHFPAPRGCTLPCGAVLALGAGNSQTVPTVVLGASMQAASIDPQPDSSASMEDTKFYWNAEGRRFVLLHLV